MRIVSYADWLPASYPWIGCNLDVVLARAAVVFCRMGNYYSGSYYSRFGALTRFMCGLPFIAAVIGAIARLG